MQKTFIITGCIAIVCLAVWAVPGGKAGVDKQAETHPPHQHPEKEIYYIVEGHAEVFLAGATRIIAPIPAFITRVIRRIASNGSTINPLNI